MVLLSCAVNWMCFRMDDTACVSSEEDGEKFLCSRIWPIAHLRFSSATSCIAISRTTAFTIRLPQKLTSRAHVRLRQVRLPLVQATCLSGRRKPRCRRYPCIRCVSPAVAVLRHYGADRRTFAVSTGEVGVSTPVTITAVYAGVTRPTTLTVTPPGQRPHSTLPSERRLTSD